MYQWRQATGSGPQHPLDIHVLLQEQHDPHNHGDVNIHYRFVTYAPCTNDLHDVVF